MPKIRIALGTCVALIGMTTARNALNRHPGPAAAHGSHALLELTESRLFSADSDNYVDITSENAYSLGNQLRVEAQDHLKSQALSTAFHDDAVLVDLGDAFRARLCGLFLEDFDRSLDDMIARGWPRYSDDRRSKLRELWEAGRDRLRPMRIDATWVEARLVNMHENATDTSGRSCSGVTPIDPASGKPLTRLSQPNGEVVEIRFRAELPAPKTNRPTQTLLAYRFTWDNALEKWRWIQTCVYYRQGDPSFPAMPPV